MPELDGGGVIAATGLPVHGGGRVYTATRPVRLADVDPSGRLRLDALARHLQDVATDDVVDAAVAEDGVSWLVRRAAMVVERWPRYLERVTYSTFCSGTGPRWADRRTSARGTEGAHVEAAVLWASFDMRTGRPARLPHGFDSIWGGAGGGRIVSARLLHRPAAPGLRGRPWQVRAADLDILGHVNNTVYWAAVEDELARLLPGTVPRAAECEHRLPLGLDDAPSIVSVIEGAALRLWLVSSRGTHASAFVETAAAG